MTITIAQDFTYIYVESDFIDAWIAEDPTHTFSLALLIKRNCGTETSIVLDADSLNIAQSRYELVPNDLGMSDFFEDGVYSLIIKKTITATGSLEFDSQCTFLDVTTGCDIIDYTADKSCPALLGFHQALSFIDSCASCECEKACIIYEYIQEKLTSDGDNSGCGCAS